MKEKDIVTLAVAVDGGFDDYTVHYDKGTKAQIHYIEDDDDTVILLMPDDAFLAVDKSEIEELKEECAKKFLDPKERS